jgi:DNA-binding NtrC family response regulator/tetratricopeptide (TPR) repeat protein
MKNDRPIDELILSATRFVHRGRFKDAADLLLTEKVVRYASPIRQPLLADMLQRTGKNRQAESLAIRYLNQPGAIPSCIAQCHFVLGNVCREHGDAQGAIAHFQAAAREVEADLELACWNQLRLVATVAELTGPQTALTLLPTAKQYLIRFGDSRPFAALHLWFAEIETGRGALERARHHLSIAESYLTAVDDMWLKGYLAINNSIVNYYSADISEARKWAALALQYTSVSCHAAGRRAALSNLGNIEFSMGNFDGAENHFRQALLLCDLGSSHSLVILDGLAQIKLRQGALTDCESIVDDLQRMASSQVGSKGKLYAGWALQTRLQLLLRQGLLHDAAKLHSDVQKTLGQITEIRLRAELSLVAAEVLIVNSKPLDAAGLLSSVLETPADMPPDLLARVEHVTARLLRQYGSPEVANGNLGRAKAIFELIGHIDGKSPVDSEPTAPDQTAKSQTETGVVRVCLDNVRALVETRRQPELCGIEAFRLLQKVECTSKLKLVVDDGSREQTLKEQCDESDVQTEQSYNVPLGSTHHRNFTLFFSPKKDCASIIATAAFRRLLDRLITPVQSPDSLTEDSFLSGGRPLLDDEFIVTADSMVEIAKTISKVARANVNVLISGETGTGKEVIARALHQQSTRSRCNFTALNCAAIPRELLESQLFGYKKGAFSGASDNFPGVLRAAAGGTLLLDEIGDFPIDLQPKLLRFLESGEIQPLGESRPIKVDVRLLFATNEDLETATKQRRFREDLLFRINVIQIKVPPLRERRLEIPSLVHHFLKRFSAEHEKTDLSISEEALELLVLFDWPGNVRQLSNEIKKFVALADDGTVLAPRHLSNEVTKNRLMDQPESSRRGQTEITVGLDQPLERAVQHLERSMLLHALRASNWRVEPAAKALGLSRKGLYLKRQRLGLTRQS